MTQDADLTPLMKQYHEQKALAGDALLLFRMGDFYELFGEDAVVASQILEITLTSRDKNKTNPLPMAGVPYHSVQGYLQKLLNAGKKVAICEQLGESYSEKGKSIVRREIVRTLTPGIQFDLEGAVVNFLGALIASPQNQIVLACIDASTGEVLVSEPSSPEEIQSDLQRLPIRHLVGTDEKLVNTFRAFTPQALVELLPPHFSSLTQATEVLKTNYVLETLDAYLTSPLQILALGVALAYTLKCQNLSQLPYLKTPRKIRESDVLVLGPKTAQHLDLLPTNDGSPNLFSLINRTKTSLGARLLKRWLLAPLKDVDAIEKRQKQIQAFSSYPSLPPGLSPKLSQIYDLERILGRVHTGLANPRDTWAIGVSLQALGEITEKLSLATPLELKPLQMKLAQSHQKLFDLGQKIIREQKDPPPLVVRDGGIFLPGTDPELDRLLALTENGQKCLIELELREKEKTGIPSLKIRYNRVFGYYIEITSTHLKNVPPHYHRKQTTVGGERFITEELKKFEDEILNAATKQKELEQSLFQELLALIRSHTAPLMEASLQIAELDSLLALDSLTQQPGWSFPEIHPGLDLDIQGGRHPLVDQFSPGKSGGRFVPNDLMLSPETRLSLIITGPNMGGKSTVMRQTALMVILGQMGAPIPAKKGSWGVVSQLHTRIGANDAISRGQSTFMVEMTELAHILHHADERSLIILDEIGRGTSTYDGISVAWATLEWIATQIRARTLFATHYHELTELSKILPQVANAHMAVESPKGAHSTGLRFLYQLKEGPANESFGIHVAKLAGLPKPIIERAWKVLENLESMAEIGEQRHADLNQLSLFQTAISPPKTEQPAQPLRTELILQELGAINPNELTPLQALNLVAKLREMSLQSASELF